jgi:ABC-type branched-subunit amino acid transport system ATPase component
VVRFGGVRAVSDASFTAQPAAITGLIGPNGAGKSTLINAVSGFVRPDSGQVLLGAADITRAPPHRRARSGLVRTFQLPRYFRGLTTMENLLVATSRQRAETALGLLAGQPYWRDQETASIARARDLLDLFEMSDKADDLPQQLSGGQQRMLELMRGLMTDPQMMLLDEPTAGLSPRWSGMLERALTELRSRGIGFVLVEHELGLVERVCDTVVVMSQGRVLSRGSMSELRTQEEVQAAYVMG